MSGKVIDSDPKIDLAVIEVTRIPDGMHALPLATEAASPGDRLHLVGNPGISAGIKSALDAIIGKPVTIPIYDINGGNGNNAWYRVIAFAGVRIMAVNFQGNPKYVIVQPANVIDPTAIPRAAQSSWTSGGVIEVYLAR